MQKKDLITQFQNMDKMPIFEINLIDYNLNDGDDYIYTYIQIDDNYLFIDNNIKVELDENFSLDEHFETLFELWIESLYNERA